MIRNVVVGTLVDGAGEAEFAQLQRGLDGLTSLQLPGLLSMSAGRTLGLRDGGWDYAIVNDWVDADAYRAYDVHPEHNVHRATIADVCAQIARVQFELPDH